METILQATDSKISFQLKKYFKAIAFLSDFQGNTIPQTHWNMDFTIMEIAAETGRYSTATFSDGDSPKIIGKVE